jgi:hypothetical protein
LIIGFCGIEILSILTGPSFYSYWQSLISAGFHSAGTIVLLYFLMERYCSDMIWPIFGACSIIPLLTEVITIFSVCFFRKLGT